MIRRSRTSIEKALRMSAPEIVRIVRIAEIAVAGEDVRAAEVVVVVVAAVAVEVAAAVTAVGMAVTAGTGAAEGIKPRIEIYKSQIPTLSHKARQGWGIR
jgi:predicted cation transporter